MLLSLLASPSHFYFGYFGPGIIKFEVILSWLFVFVREEFIYFSFFIFLYFVEREIDEFYRLTLSIGIIKHLTSSSKVIIFDGFITETSWSDIIEHIRVLVSPKALLVEEIFSFAKRNRRLTLSLVKIKHRTCGLRSIPLFSIIISI